MPNAGCHWFHSEVHGLKLYLISQAHFTQRGDSQATARKQAETGARPRILMLSVFSSKVQERTTAPSP